MAIAEKLRRTAAGLAGHLSGFLDQLLLVNQPAEIRLVQGQPGERLDGVLQLQKRKILRHQFEDDRAVFDLGAQTGNAGRQDTAVIGEHRAPDALL
ncbi:hypothetical protein D3C87_1946630 [compost metagenome]